MYKSLCSTQTEPVVLISMQVIILPDLVKKISVFNHLKLRANIDQQSYDFAHPVNLSPQFLSLSLFTFFPLSISGFPVIQFVTLLPGDSGLVEQCLFLFWFRNGWRALYHKSLLHFHVKNPGPVAAWTAKVRLKGNQTRCGWCHFSLQTAVYCLFKKSI